MPRFHNSGSERVQFTEAEEAAQDAGDAQEVIKAQARADAIVAQEATDAQNTIDKASGNQKLVDLGLTQDEVDALTT